MSPFPIASRLRRAGSEVLAPEVVQNAVFPAGRPMCEEKIGLVLHSRFLLELWALQKVSTRELVLPFPF